MSFKANGFQTLWLKANDFAEIARERVFLKMRTRQRLILINCSHIYKTIHSVTYCFSGGSSIKSQRAAKHLHQMHWYCHFMNCAFLCRIAILCLLGVNEFESGACKATVPAISERARFLVGRRIERKVR